MKISRVIPLILFLSLILFSCKPVNDDTPTYTDFSSLNNGTPSEVLYELTIELEAPQSELINPDENDILLMAYNNNMETVLEYLIDNPLENSHSETTNYTDTETGALYLLTSTITVIDSDTYDVLNEIAITGIILNDAEISFYDSSTRILTEGTVSGTGNFSLSYDLEIEYEEVEEEIIITITNEVIDIEASGLFTVSGFHGISSINYSYSFTIKDENGDGIDEVSEMDGTYSIDGTTYSYSDFEDYE